MGGGGGLGFSAVGYRGLRFRVKGFLGFRLLCFKV